MRPKMSQREIPSIETFLYIGAKGKKTWLEKADKSIVKTRGADRLFIG
jgi:hypothetical protein